LTICAIQLVDAARGEGGGLGGGLGGGGDGGGGLGGGLGWNGLDGDQRRRSVSRRFSQAKN
jgi:hypothetical protein